MSELMDRLDTIVNQLNQLNALIRASLNATMNEEEAARLLGVSESYLRGVREAGKITFIGLGGSDKRYGRILYTRDDIIEYLKKNRRAIV